MKLTNSVTQFRVSNLDSALEFYATTLGFTEKFRFGDYAGVCRSNVQLHLLGPSVPNGRQIGEGAIYIFSADVNACFEEIVAQGGRPAGEPEDRPYGLRDFLVTDPDGNALTFGQRLPKEPKKARAAAIPPRYAPKSLQSVESRPVTDSSAVLAWQRYIAKISGKELPSQTAGEGTELQSAEPSPGG
jgi:uncharacterized glyoxalase superfamily protein PhnB